MDALLAAALDLADAVDAETAALESMRGNSGVAACKAAESRVTDCCARLRAVIAEVETR